MRINPQFIKNNPGLFVRPSPAINQVEAAVSNSKIEHLTPQSYNFGPVSQLINSKYLYELKKNVKKILKGKKLKEALSHQYSAEEFDELPLGLQNLIIFDKAITSAEILQFIESLDESHEITFRDFNYDRIKFRAMFEALGSLIDVEMQAGLNTFVSLSDGFPIKEKIKRVFGDLKDKIKQRFGLKSKAKKLDKNENN